MCWPSREEISRRTGIHRIATISAALSRLADVGFIVRERGQRGVRYRFDVNGGGVIGGPDVAPSATPEILDVAEDATPENGDYESRRSATRTSDVAPSATPANTLFENKKKNTIREKSPTPPEKAKKKSVSAKVQKDYPGDLDADAAKLIAMFGDVVKPFNLDNSGSKTDFTATAKNLLSNGVPYSDLERAARNYAASRLVEERKKRNPEEQVQFRWGFQTFYGPKHQHWKDHVAEKTGEPDAISANDSRRPKPSGALEQMEEAKREAQRLMENTREQQLVNA